MGASDDEARPPPTIVPCHFFPFWGAKDRPQSVSPHLHCSSTSAPRPGEIERYLAPWTVRHLASAPGTQARTLRWYQHR